MYDMIAVLIYAQEQKNYGCQIMKKGLTGWLSITWNWTKIPTHIFVDYHILAMKITIILIRHFSL